MVSGKCPTTPPLVRVRVKFEGRFIFRFMGGVGKWFPRIDPNILCQHFLTKPYTYINVYVFTICFEGNVTLCAKLLPSTNWHFFLSIDWTVVTVSKSRGETHQGTLESFQTRLVLWRGGGGGRDGTG